MRNQRSYGEGVRSELPIVDHPRVRAWLEIREPLERQLEPLGRAALRVLRLSPGERVLDVGCGIGGTPAALAHAVGPNGRVVGLELLQAAVEVAKREADLPKTVSFECGDAQTYPFDPGSFDAVFSRFGMMFFADARAALFNMNKALRRGGRLSFVCWRGLAENELDDFPLRAAAAHLPPHLVSETAKAAWFSFSDPEHLRMVLGAAGFVQISIDPHDELVSSGSLEAMVAVCSRVGALGAILREHPHLGGDAIAGLRDALAERDGPVGPELRAATWIVSARVGA